MSDTWTGYILGVVTVVVILCIGYGYRVYRRNKNKSDKQLQHQNVYKRAAKPSQSEIKLLEQHGSNSSAQVAEVIINNYAQDKSQSISEAPAPLQPSAPAEPEYEGEQNVSQKYI